MYSDLFIIFGLKISLNNKIQKRFLLYLKQIVNKMVIKIIYNASYIDQIRFDIAQL